MASRFIDLTLSLSSRTPVYPGEPAPVLTRTAEFAKEGYVSSKFEMGAHAGTHVDAPMHFLANGKPLSHFPIERFCGLTGVLVDVRGKKEIDETALAGVSLSNGCAVLFWTGYTDAHPTAFSQDDAPALTPRLARALVKAQVGLVGIDSFSVDFGEFDVHKILLAGDVLINETLTNLAMLAAQLATGKQFKHYALPLKLLDTDGAPARAFAQLQ